MLQKQIRSKRMIGDDSSDSPLHCQDAQDFSQPTRLACNMRMLKDAERPFRFLSDFCTATDSSVSVVLIKYGQSELKEVTNGSRSLMQKQSGC